MRIKTRSIPFAILAMAFAARVALLAQDKPRPSSYAPVDIHEAFAATMNRMSAAKSGIMTRQTALLAERYDLSDRSAPGVTMSRNKPVQQWVRVKLPTGVTWDQLGKLTPDQIKARDIFPAGFLPLPHPNHAEGGMLFPKFEIDEMKKQEDRDLTRFGPLVVRRLLRGSLAPNLRHQTEIAESLSLGIGSVNQVLRRCEHQQRSGHLHSGKNIARNATLTTTSSRLTALKTYGKPIWRPTSWRWEPSKSGFGQRQ